MLGDFRTATFMTSRYDDINLAWKMNVDTFNWPLLHFEQMNFDVTFTLGQWRHQSYGPKTTLTYTTSEHIILLQKMINYCGWKLGKPIEILFYLLLNNFLKKNISFRTIFFDYEILTPFLSVTILLRIFIHRYNIEDRSILNY